MEKGFYTLNQTVPNPQVDRRSKAYHSVSEWKAGMRVIINPATGTCRGTIEFPDGTRVYFGGGDPNVDQGDALIPHLEKAPFAIGQVFRDPFNQAEPQDVLALAYGRGILSREQVELLASEIGQWDEEYYSTFKKIHWLK